MVVVVLAVVVVDVDSGLVAVVVKTAVWSAELLQLTYNLVFEDKKIFFFTNVNYVFCSYLFQLFRSKVMYSREKSNAKKGFSCSSSSCSKIFAKLLCTYFMGKTFISFLWNLGKQIEASSSLVFCLLWFEKCLIIQLFSVL